MAATKLQEQQRAARAAAARGGVDLHPAQTAVGPGRCEYQALTALSIPQRTEKGVLTGQNDLVVRGETVWLEETEARNLMATGQRTGRRYPAIRPVSEIDDELPRLHPRMLSGSLRAPVQPAPGTDAARPDPAGASKLLIREIPEAQEPQPGDEAVGVDPDAIDITPGTARV